MKVLNKKRARLRDELQQAYDTWVLAGEAQARQAMPANCVRVDISGASGVAGPQWLEYLAAKKRLVLAYAEQPLAA